MKIKNSTPLSLGWMVSKIRSQDLSATFIVKGTFDLRPNGPAKVREESDPLSGDEFKEIAGRETLSTISDFAPWKPNADLLFSGTCHTPGKKEEPTCPVGVQVGAWAKQLSIVGDRYWKYHLTGFRPTQPKPFTEMPLGWPLSFGGPQFPDNPIGRGYAKKMVEDQTRIWRLPNIETPGESIQKRTGRTNPAGFGPIDSTWAPRNRKVATYDAKWRENHWPWFPKDFDWTHFNAAPADQQVPFLRGDETLRFENMHPEIPRYESSLPGLRPQCFVVRAGQRIEVPLVLDTLQVDLDEEKLTLTWRGHTPVSHIKMKEIEEVALLSTPLEKNALDLPLAQEAIQKIEESEKEEEKREEEEEAREENEMKEAVEELNKKVEDLEKEALSKLDDTKEPMTLAEGLAEYDLLQKSSMDSPYRETPLPDLDLSTEDLPSVSEDWSREKVEKAIEKNGSLADQDLSGLDLSGLNLCGQSFQNSELTGTNLSETNLEGANFSGADLEKAILAKARLTGADLSDATFEKADLTAAHLENSSAPGADFTEADFTGAVLVEGIFSQANFTDCLLDQCDFSRANLSAAVFDGAKGKEVVMKEANLTGIHMTKKVSFPKANFQKITAPESIWEEAELAGADFREAELSRATFSDAILVETLFTLADLRHATFDDAQLQKASFDRVNLLGGSLERSNLSETNLKHSNLYEVELWDAKLTKTNLEGANLAGTKLA